MKNLSTLFFVIFFTLSEVQIMKAEIPVDPSLASVLQTRIDSLVAQNNLPGISVTILLPGERIWNGASGLSNINTLTPMDTSYLFQMASVNKMFTAAMIFQLKEQGLLSLDDTVGKFLPPILNVPSSITIANLLQHKSGIADIAHNSSIINEWILHPDSVWPHIQTIETFGDTIGFPQGQFFEYSNTNYILLGMIIEQITGNSFANELRNRFCIPNNLTQIFFAPDDSIAGPQTPGWTSFSLPGVYNTDASLILNDCSASMFFTAGSIIAKPADVARFTKLLWSGQIISDSSLNIMKQCTNVNFGQGCNGYGYGTMRYVFGGKNYYGHAGDVNGFTQLSIYQQTDSVAITVSVNRNNAPRGVIADTLLRLITQTLLTAIDESVSDETDFAVYPNPSSDKINLHFNCQANKNIGISIINQFGNLVFKTTSLKSEELNEYAIDVSKLPAGIYFVNLKSNKQNITRRIVVLNAEEVK